MTFPVNYEDNISAKDFPGIPAEDPRYIYYEDGIMSVTVIMILLVLRLPMILVMVFHIPHLII